MNLNMKNSNNNKSSNGDRNNSNNNIPSNSLVIFKLNITSQISLSNIYNSLPLLTRKHHQHEITRAFADNNGNNKNNKI